MDELFVVLKQGFGLQTVGALFKIYGESLLEKQAFREELEWLSARRMTLQKNVQEQNYYPNSEIKSSSSKIINVAVAVITTFILITTTKIIFIIQQHH